MHALATILLAALTTATNGYPQPHSTTSVQGVIISITRSQVILQTTPSTTIALNDQQALNNNTAQDVAIGNLITAYGYWSAKTFYATSIAPANVLVKPAVWH